MSNPYILPGSTVGNVAAIGVKQTKRPDWYVNIAGEREDGTQVRFDSIKFYADNPDHAPWIKGFKDGSLTVEDFFASVMVSHRSGAANTSGVVIRKASVTPEAQ